MLDVLSLYEQLQLSRQKQDFLNFLSFAETTQRPKLRGTRHVLPKMKVPFGRKIKFCQLQTKKKKTTTNHDFKMKMYSFIVKVHNSSIYTCRMKRLTMNFKPEEENEDAEAVKH